MRAEFPKKIKMAAYERAAGKCESCGLPLRVGKFDYDHVLPDALGGQPTLANCRVICTGCHATKTRGDVGMIRKADRQRAKHIGAKPKRAWPGTDKWKRKINGETVLR